MAAEKLKEALRAASKSGRYLVTVTYLDSATGLLNHQLDMLQFPIEDIETSFTELKKLSQKGVDEPMGVKATKHDVSQSGK